MNRNEPLLGKLADWRPADGRQALHVAAAASGWATTLTVERADQLGCLVWELDLRKSAPAARDAEALEAWAQRVASRATGLLESLKVVEIDPARGEALLRSESPVSRGENVLYYEVMLAGAGAASLQRYEATKNGGNKRQQVAFALTHEALAKLAVDLTDA